MGQVIVIAEAGVNHNGDLNRAKELIGIAADAGADYIKFQTFMAKELVVDNAPKAKYQEEATGKSESQSDMLRRLELTSEDHHTLMEHCRKAGIGFFSTGFDHESNQLLYQLGLDFFKVPSGEVTNIPYLRQIGGFGKPVILSTGMCTLGEIEVAIGELTNAGVPRVDITVLHCNTQYPTPMSDVNLNAMLTIRNAMKVEVGYSDHTLGIEIPIAAVAMGASVIEKHFTIDRNLPGPDHAASLEPQELKEMMAAIRNIEIALGNGIKGPSNSERENLAIARKSIVARRAINHGQTLTVDDLATKRSQSGVSAAQWDQMIGRVANRDYRRDDLLEW